MRVALFSTGLLAGLLLVLVAWSSRVEVRAEAELLPVTFAHADHISQNCVECHHNYVDEVGFGANCLACHKTDESVAHLIEPQFHDLCRGCHEEHMAAGEATGPVRECLRCHTADDDP